MSSATFIFHGLYPAKPPAPHSHTRHLLAQVLFDVDYSGTLISHALAGLYLLEKDNELEVRFDLPFECPDFPAAVVQYYQQIMGPQSKTVSHSGPKGKSVVGHDVIRVEWRTRLQVESEPHSTRH